MVGDAGRINLRDIARRLLPEIRLVCTCRKFVELGREYDLDPPRLIKAQSRSANTGKQVNAAVVCMSRIRERHNLGEIENRLELQAARAGLALFPAPDGAIAVLRHARSIRQFLLRHTQTRTFLTNQRGNLSVVHRLHHIECWHSFTFFWYILAVFLSAC